MEDTENCLSKKRELRNLMKEERDLASLFFLYFDLFLSIFHLSSIYPVFSISYSSIPYKYYLTILFIKIEVVLFLGFFFFFLLDFTFIFIFILDEIHWTVLLILALFSLHIKAFRSFLYKGNLNSLCSISLVLPSLKKGA